MFRSTISIHALREEGDLDSDPPEPRPVGISIHALREEGDGFWAAQRLSTTVFLSTPSARRATQVDVEILIFRGISIHALREEGDSYFLRSSSI